ncbi:MAG TPA: aldehyde ferredoxin oxidoreductase family protein [bacterium]|nr:aldehyde ferredoxin oxidoreductase family protein [bacterium]
MATEYKGFMGKWLWVDLSNNEVKEFDVSDRDRELFFGNKAMATKILLDYQKPGIDPLSPEALLIVNTGPLTGSMGPCTSRFNAAAKSPLTGAIGTSNCGGNFGLNMKKCGYDGIVISGKADKPVYIDITDDRAEVKDAAHLWGKNTEETQEAMDKKAGKLVIGPAGENLVKYACMISQERAAGRCGLGAVMGSKNLKALQAKGKKKIEAADPEGFKQAIQYWTKLIKEHPTTGELLPKLGTANMVNLINSANAFPTHNFKRGQYEDAEKISGEKLAEDYLVKNMGCVSCPIRCGRVVEVDGKNVKGPEFETVGLFGSNIENNDLGLINKWNRQMDLLGMDTISLGNTLGFTMELKEKGMLECDLEFGKFDNIEKTIDDIAYRRGIGDDMAEGVKAMSEKYGGSDFAIHARGLEIASYDPRSSVGLGLGYATANRGGCHLNAGYMMFMEHLGPVNMDPYSPAAKAGWAIFQQNLFEAVSSSGNCIFTTYPVLHKSLHKINKRGTIAKITQKVLGFSGPVMDMSGALLPWGMNFQLPIMIPHSLVISKLTGMNITMGKFLHAGERCFNIERLFNIREDIAGKADTLPGRMLHEDIDPDRKNSTVPLDKMLPRFYKVRGWDKNGIPTLKKLKNLGLEQYASIIGD